MQIEAGLFLQEKKKEKVICQMLMKLITKWMLQCKCVWDYMALYLYMDKYMHIHIYVYIYVIIYVIICAGDKYIICGYKDKSLPRIVCPLFSVMGIPERSE